MKNLKALFLSVFALILPTIAMASTSGGGFGGGLQLVSIGQQIINFLTGPIALILITLGFIGGGIAIMFGRENDQRGYRRLGMACVGGSVIIGAASLVSFFFSGAMI